MRVDAKAPAGTIAVVGAGGLVGTAIVKLLRSQGLPVVAIVRNSLAAAVTEALIPGCEVRIGSVSDGEAAPALLDGCMTVVNCALAGSGGVPANAYTRNEEIVDGILHAPVVRRIVHFSSVAVYGETFLGAADEQKGFASPKPNSEYGRSKLHVERYAIEKCSARGVAVTALRLGHVYGPGVFRSREIIELALDPKFELPFDGRYQSNGIHIDTVAQAVRVLLAQGTGPDVANLLENGRTWRDVFDWHTAAIGAAPAKRMSDAASRGGQQAHLDRSVARATARWAKSLSIGDLVRQPAVFDVGLRTLARTPAWLTTQAKAANRKMKSRGGAAVTGSSETWPSLYYSERAPGLNFGAESHSDIPRTLTPAQDAAMQAWHRRITEPRLP